MPSPALLVGLDQAKRQLRVTHDEDDLDILEKLAEAEDIILVYLKAQADETWTDDTVPGAVKAAILKQTVFLWRFRGDDEGRQDIDDHGLAPGVRALLSFYRDPALG